MRLLGKNNFGKIFEEVFPPGLERPGRDYSLRTHILIGGNGSHGREGKHTSRLEVKIPEKNRAKITRILLAFGNVTPDHPLHTVKIFPGEGLIVDKVHCQNVAIRSPRKGEPKCPAWYNGPKEIVRIEFGIMHRNGEEAMSDQHNHSTPPRVVKALLIYQCR
jgi:hypothetical protein